MNTVPEAHREPLAIGGTVLFSVSGIEGAALMPTNTIVTGPVTDGRHGWRFSLPLTAGLDGATVSG
jgi:hypothetical protein